MGIRIEVLCATRIRWAPAGGSSSVFSRALAACGVIRSAGQRSATRGRSENALRESSSRSARISSIRRNCVSGVMKRKLGWAPEASSRQSGHDPHAPSFPGFRQRSAAANARAAFSFPTPSSPEKRSPWGTAPAPMYRHRRATARSWPMTAERGSTIRTAAPPPGGRFGTPLLPGRRRRSGRSGRGPLRRGGGTPPARRGGSRGIPAPTGPLPRRDP